MYNLVLQWEVIERIKVIKEDLVLISEMNNGLSTFATAKETIGRQQGDMGDVEDSTGDGSETQTDESSESGGTREPALVVDGYACMWTISNKIYYCLADSWKIETDSTYRCPMYLSSNKVAPNSLSRSTATWMSKRFWNICTVGNNRAIISFGLSAYAHQTWDQGLYSLSANLLNS